MSSSIASDGNGLVVSDPSSVRELFEKKLTVMHSMRRHFFCVSEQLICSSRASYEERPV